MSSTTETSEQNKSKLYGPVATLVITVCIFFGVQIIGGIVLALIPAWSASSPEQIYATLEANPWLQFLSIAFIEIITLWLIYKFLKRRKASFRDIGLNKLQARHLLLALGGFAVYFILFVVVAAVVMALFPGLDTEQRQELGFDMASKGINLLPIFLSLVILAPITEEIVARGFLYGGLRSRIPPVLAALITSLLFGAAHLAGGDGSGLLWMAALDTFVLSMVLCSLREKTKSLWPSIGVHMMKNSLAFVVLFNIFR